MTVPQHGGGAVHIYRTSAVDNTSHESTQSNTAIFEDGLGVEKRGPAAALPAHYSLGEAYPNPFNPSTRIDFDLPEDGFVTLSVFDVLGRTIAEITNGSYVAGYHSATWNASNQASGIYFARFVVTGAAGEVKYSKMSKLVLMK